MRIVVLCSVVKWHLQDPQVLAGFISWDDKRKKTKLGGISKWPTPKNSEAS
jgi:hypothetical protein